MSEIGEVGVFYDPEEAYCARGLLQAAGYACVLMNDNHLSVAPGLRVALGGYRLYAAGDEIANAREILASLPTLEQETSTPKEGGELPDKRHWNWFWLPVALSHGVPFVPKIRSAGGFIVQMLITIPFLLAFLSPFLW